ncbi:ATP-binding protein [Martelella soudanensis]|uniref:ATP-binding protein n=1 Tax=unclassified Martelella TaxID=2629616 RepID=UPI0015DDD514|nr:MULTISPECIES: ATP-binding protein [unclassified Martelella]
MNSLRRRLFILLVVASAAIWAAGVIWISTWSRLEVQHVLDTRLQEAARMVHSLVSTSDINAARENGAFAPVDYEKQLSCQIWSLDGHLVARSSGAPAESIALNEAGFGDAEVNGEAWRVYTIIDVDKGVRVAVGDRIGLRDRLVRDLLAGLVIPAALILPVFGFLIWLSLGRGLRPLNRIAHDITARDGEDMRAIDAEDAPLEVRPLVDALNGLFGKVDAARRHERELTAFAAHELKTPLAGLRMQAQIARAAKDDTIRDQALGQILVSVDRTDRLVRQLLTLARLEAEPEKVRRERLIIGDILDDVVEGIPKSGETMFDDELARTALVTNAEMLHLVLRNLHENALQHAGKDGRVRWRVTANGAGICVEDSGPGVREDDLALLTRRFYRGRDNRMPGTGLGLTIAAMAASRLGAALTFDNLPDRKGFRVTISPL